MNNFFVVKLLCICLFCLGSTINAQSIQISTYSIPFGAQKLKAVDMNNDQKTDLIVMSNAQETGFAIYYGNGDESFGLPLNYQKELNFVNFDVADLNRDGYMDLVLSSYWFNGFKLYLGDENKQFNFATSYNMDGHATGVTISDIDGDGFQDVLGITSGSGSPVTLNVFKGDKNGYLHHSGKYPTLLSGNLNTYVVDKNGDHLPDVLVSTRSWLALFYQQIGGTYLLKYWPTDMASITVGDVNNDKLPDMVLGYTEYNMSREGDSILIRTGSADTLFNAQPLKMLTPGVRPGFMCLADLNNDQLPELIISQLNVDGETTDSLYVFRGKGNNGFVLSGIYKLPETIKSFTVSDLKNDSFPEIILISDKTLMIMHNSGNIISSTHHSPDADTAKIYLNPVQNKLFLDFPDSITNIRIVDVYGKTLFVSNGSYISQVDMRAFVAGIYIVQGFQQGKQVIAKKIMKM